MVSTVVLFSLSKKKKKDGLCFGSVQGSIFYNINWNAVEQF